MQLRKFNLEDFDITGNCRWQLLFPWEDVVQTPFYSGWTHLKPGQSTRKHKHHEIETYFIAKGQGELESGDETVPVASGDVVYLPPFHDHVLVNKSDQELLFLSVFWEDLSILLNSESRHSRGAPKQVCLTSTLPETIPGEAPEHGVEGPGRSSVAADIQARWLRMKGQEAHHVVVADASKAEDAAAVRSRLADSKIEPDAVSGLWDSANEARLKDLVAGLHAAGKLVVEERAAPSCDRCRRDLASREVRGDCPQCNVSTTGLACPSCSRPVELVSLRGATCCRCDSPVAIKTERRLVFPLSDYREALTESLIPAAMPPWVKAICESVLAAGLEDVVLSHGGAGIPVPLAGLEGQSLETEWATFSTLLYGADGEQSPDFWRRGEGRAVHCIGRHEIFHHALLYPALLLAVNGEFRSPVTLVVDAGLPGSEASAGAPADRGRSSADAGDTLRLQAVGCATEPFADSTALQVESLTWLAELRTKLDRELDGVVPGTGLWTDEQRLFHQRLVRLVAEVDESYSPTTFSPPEIVAALLRSVRSTRRFAASEDAWVGIAGRKDERRTSLALELVALKTLGMLAAPLLPALSHRLLAGLGYETAPPVWEPVPDWVPSGRRLAA